MDDTVIRVSAPSQCHLAEVAHEYAHVGRPCGNAWASARDLPKSRTTCAAAGIRREIPAQTRDLREPPQNTWRLCDVTLAHSVDVADLPAFAPLRLLN
ncbi:hypothetical protein ABT300_15255 [Streptomyces sp. NPDC001027]|uniref:hypothetical protein n=1 Tax=Streptomyces sp. NPDC001027 TaxID=3154771 RepID=UPI003320BDFB